MIAYCVKCREKREMEAPEPTFTAKGMPATRGKCGVCGTTLVRMGATPEHEGLPKPEITATPAKKTSKKPTSGTKKKGGTSKGGDRRNLVIVESPAKARTIGKFLGRGYNVKASVGHVRDLLRSQLSVDVENDFTPKYRVPNEKRAVVKEIRTAAESAPEVFLATDPDREGEAIAWHLVQATEMAEPKIRRVVFHEITDAAIKEAFARPRTIDLNRVNAQQARRILDRLVGYKISPLLWANVRNRTSAGRVQSVALRLIVDREREIEAFVPQEYWSIEAELAKHSPARPSFVAKLHKIDGEQASLKNQVDTQAIVRELERAGYVVTDVKRGQRKRYPSPPFTTSTLQQEASRRLGFTARRTMRAAQQLYEGIEIGDQGTVGLISYMRTDSTHVAETAQAEARRFISQRYGAEQLPESSPVYRTKTKGAQEAHEAIRPTSIFREPSSLNHFLNKDQQRLYALIWQRFVASQMAPAVYDTMSVDVVAQTGRSFAPGCVIAAADVADLTAKPRFLFRAAGSQVRFSGFLSVYEETRDEDAAPDSELGKILPDLEIGEVVDLQRLIPEQHFTEPPPRFTEATLVRTLEEYGIGRPSTYAPIITTIQDRGYVDRRERRLHPKELGFVVNDLLVEHFPDVMDLEFTARMEEDLDQIARGERPWVPVLREFYVPFEKAVESAEKGMEKVSVTDQPTGEMCDMCGHEMVLKFGRFGKFIACSNYPECRNTKPFLEKIGVKCPQCGGELIERRSRRGKVFYGCSKYPECSFTSWKKPVPQPCPACGGLMVMNNHKTAVCTKCGEQITRGKLSPEGESGATPDGEAR